MTGRYRYKGGLLIDIFTYIKERVTARQAFEYYGLTVDGHGFCRCPFHNDRHPSMKADEKFYCFGCGAHGDAIDFVSKFFSLSVKEAALKIIDDFGYGDDMKLPAFSKPCFPKAVTETMEEWLLKATDILFSCRDYLRKEQSKYAPKSRNEEISSHMAEVTRSLEQVEYVLEVATGSTMSKREILYYEAKESVEEIGKLLKQIGTDEKTETKKEESV